MLYAERERRWRSIEEILFALEVIKKELQDIRSILEPKKFIPESNDGPCTTNNKGCFDMSKNTIV